MIGTGALERFEDPELDLLGVARASRLADTTLVQGGQRQSAQGKSILSVALIRLSRKGNGFIFPYHAWKPVTIEVDQTFVDRPFWIAFQIKYIIPRSSVVLRIGKNYE